MTLIDDAARKLADAFERYQHDADIAFKLLQRAVAQDPSFVHPAAAVSAQAYDRRLSTPVLEPLQQPDAPAEPSGGESVAVSDPPNKRRAPRWTRAR